MRRMQAVICLAVTLLAAACTAAPGPPPPRDTVAGRLIREGGPLGPHGKQPATIPLPGTVRFTDGHHQMITIRIGRTGRFSGLLPAGRYSVSYRSPRLLEVGSDGIGRQFWSQQRPVKVTPHQTTRITLTAIVP